jgi:cold shock CspA family protein
MARSQQTTGKKDREKKKAQQRKEKDEKRKERKEKQPKSFDDMIAYVDEYGRFSSTPPEKKAAVKAEDMEIGVSRKAEGEGAEDNLHRGTVTNYNESKGYGFIKDIDTKQSIFVHVSEMMDEIREGNLVTFEIGKGPRGPVAMKVSLAK